MGSSVGGGGDEGRGDEEDAVITEERPGSGEVEETAKTEDDVHSPGEKLTTVN